MTLPAARRGLAAVTLVALLAACADDAATDPETAPSDTGSTASPSSSIEPSTPQESASPDPAATAPVSEEDALIVAFSAGSAEHDDQAARAELMGPVAERLGLEVEESFALGLPGTFVYSVAGAQVEADLAEIIAVLEKLDVVEYAEPNGMVSGS